MFGLMLCDDCGFSSVNLLASKLLLFLAVIGQYFVYACNYW